jgi:imidazolonepropionase-like amidohydrolase
MNRLLAALAVTVSAAALAGAADAQNLVVTGGRIITGTGQVIEKGSVVVENGKIAKVAAGPAGPAPKGAKVINAAGMTVIAGYIDDHRHLIQGRTPEAAAKFMKDDAATAMRELLESGVTTVQSGGDNNEAILELKKKVESGEIKGPRIIASARVPTGNLPDEAAVRAAVDKAHASGADSIAEVIFPMKSFPTPPTEQERKNLAWAVDEANKVGIPLQVHAVSPGAMMESVRAGVKKLIHTPHLGWLTEEEATAAAAAGAQVSSCAGFGAPVFAVFNHDNKPTFRDGRPWPGAILDGQGRGREAGYKPVNGRTLFDDGVEYGYCTDTTYNATAALAHELKVLNLTFSPIDLVQVMGKNSADFVDMGDKIGTLEPGKFGDLLVLGGNPMDGYWNFLTAVVVVKGGVIMIDKRGQPNAGKPIVHNP